MKEESLLLLSDLQKLINQVVLIDYTIIILGGELMSEVTGTFDFMPIGQAIKKARERSGITREQLAEQLDITPRHLQSI